MSKNGHLCACVVPCLPLQQNVNSEGFLDLYLSILCFYIVSSCMHASLKMRGQVIFFCDPGGFFVLRRILFFFLHGKLEIFI